MPAMEDLSLHLPATESPMVEWLAFRHASNGRSQCPPTLYRKSEWRRGQPSDMPATVDLSVHLPPTEGPWRRGQLSYMPTTVELSVHLPATESPMAEGLAFRHPAMVNFSIHLPSTESPMAGVSHPTCQHRYILVCTYRLKKTPR